MTKRQVFYSFYFENDLWKVGCKYYAYSESGQLIKRLNKIQN